MDIEQFRIFATLISELGSVALALAWVYAERNDNKAEQERVDKMIDKVIGAEEKSHKTGERASERD